MGERYPGYDVLAKRDTPSFNEITRRVVDRRLAIDPNVHRFFTEREWETLCALCARMVPQPPGRARTVPLAAMVDLKMQDDRRDGWRDARLPVMRVAWRRALHALDEETLACHGARFHLLAPDLQDDCLRAMQRGELAHAAWGGMPSKVFFDRRVVVDVVKTYYAHPAAWSEIGFGGPASPRGYVRMDFDRRDPWEAAEARPGDEQRALRENLRVGR